MTEEEVVMLMGSSTSSEDWNRNCDKVKKTCGGYPDFWYKAIIMSGLANRVLKKENLITIESLIL